MTKTRSGSICRAAFAGLLALTMSGIPLLGEDTSRSKIVGGYFEEWSIYYAGYNVANLQQNGVATALTHLFYAFSNVTTSPSAACVLADTWADYQDPYLPASAASLTRVRCTAISPPFNNSNSFIPVSTF